MTLAPGLSRDLLIPRDFVMLHLELVDLLPSLEAAVLLLRIQYRAGDGWWEVTKAEMQADCRLSEWKLDRALRELIDGGFIEWVRIGPDDNRRKCRVRYAEGVGRKPPEGREETSSTPSTKKVRTISSSRCSDASKDEGFMAFYRLYPRHEARGDAHKAWHQMTKDTDPACIMAGLQAQVVTLTAKKPEGFCPLPATWLRAERWNDEFTPRIDRDAPRQPGESVPDYNRRRGFE